MAVRSGQRNIRGNARNQRGGSRRSASGGGVAYLHAWSNASVPAVGGAAGTAYELGTLFKAVSTPVTIYGVRIWNPGTFARTSRSAKLWEYTDNTAAGTPTKQREVTLPDTMPVGWTEYQFSSSYPLTTAKAIIVSYDTGPATPGDYGQIVSALTSAVPSADGKISVFTGGYSTGTDGAAFSYLSTFFGVDVLYSAP
jgi:hypothetical protein